MLRLRQDDDEVEAAREDEPFVTGPLDETTLLREVFFDALGHDDRAPATDDFERLYTLHVAVTRAPRVNSDRPVRRRREAAAPRVSGQLERVSTPARPGGTTGYSRSIASGVPVKTSESTASRARSSSMSP